MAYMRDADGRRLDAMRVVSATEAPGIVTAAAEGLFAPRNQADDSLLGWEDWSKRPDAAGVTLGACDDLGGVWNGSSLVQVLGGKLLPYNLAARGYLVRELYVQDVHYRFTFTMHGTTADVGPVFRSSYTSAGANRLYVRCRKLATGTGTSNSITLLCQISNADTTVVAVNDYGWTLGKRYVIDVFHRGKSTLVKVNGVAVMSGTLSDEQDAALTGNSVGVTWHHTNDGGSGVERMEWRRLNERVPVSTRWANHNGSHGGLLENSLETLRRTPRGIKAIEADVAITSDNEPVMMHNTTVDATTNGTGTVTSLTFAQVRALMMDDGTQVPTFLEYLDTIAATQPDVDTILVDYTFSAGFPYGVAVAEAHDLADRCIHMAQSTAQLATLRALGAGLRLGIYGLTNANSADYIAAMTANGAELALVSPNDATYLANRTAVADVKAAGFKVGASTTVGSAATFAAIADGAFLILHDYSAIGPRWSRFVEVA